MKVRTTYLLAALLLFAFTLAAQQPGGGAMDPNRIPKIGVLAGKLVDSETGEPLAFGAVKVVHKMSDELVTGGMTDDQGRFKIEGIAMGPNTVEFAYVGYTTMTKEVRFGRESTTVDLGDVKLVSSGMELEEVTVSAEREFMTNEIDRRVYDPSKLIMARTGSATDILENIPSVELDIEGNITLRGSSAVRIMIDGRPSRFTGQDLSALLQSLPGNSVERIEVMTNPSAKYDPDGTAGMINIVLKKSALQGLNGSVNASYSGADRIRGGVNLNYKTGDFNYFLNAGHSSGGYPRSNWSNQISNLADGQYTTYRESEGLGGRNGNNIKLGFDWTPGTKHVLTLQGTINQGLRPRWEDRTIAWTTPTLDYTVSQISDEDGRRWDNAFDAIYDFKPSQNEELNVRFSYTDGTRDDRMDFTQDTVVSAGVKVPSLHYNTESFADRWEFNGLVDYTKKMSGDRRLESGVKVILRDDIDGFRRYDTDLNTGINTLDPYSVNEFLYSEDIYAAYTNYAFKTGKWGFQLGARAEQANIAATQITQDSTFYNNYFQIYPSAYVTYELARGREINISYSRRVERPGGRQLNPFVDYSDPYNLRKGNPYLLPEFSGAYEIGYTHILKKGHTITSSAYFRDKSNMISWFNYVDSNGIRTTTFENLNQGEDYGTEFNIRGKLGDKGAFASFGGNAFYSVVRGEVDGIEWLNQGFGFGLNSMVSTPLWEGGSLQLMGNYRGRRITAQGIGRPMYFVGGGFKQSFMNDRLNLSVNCRDIFNTMGWNYENYGPNWYSEGQFRWMSRVVEFGVTYNFGEVQRRRREASREGGRGDGDMEMF